VLILRTAEARDAVEIAEIYRPIVEGTAISFEEQAPTAADMTQRIATTLRTHPWLVCADGGAILGYAYAGEHRTRPAYRWSADVTVYVSPQARRRGVGRVLYQGLLDTLARQGFRNAFAGIALPNPASVGLHESLGFAHIGIYRAVGFKLGSWHDVGWWQNTIGSPDAAPSDLVPFARLGGI
jgi:L-amino acid N-acyltransferase YncA